jgi:MFS family permease
MTSLAAIPRAGQLECICEPGALGNAVADRRGTALLAGGFAFSVLAQVLTLSILPLAGLSLAPSQGLATLPYAAFYAGAALASLPASFLLDSFGRRAAFSLGASLGAAGGAVLVWALVAMHFGALVLGAFWLGIAGGFSLFYRHAAVPVGGKGTSALLLVFGAATLASLAAPTIAGAAEALASPRIFAGTAAAAALAHVVSLAATAALPYQSRRDLESATGLQGGRAILLPTLIGACGWFAMTALMGATPIAVFGCAPSEAAVGAVAWHVMAMYTPSLVLAFLPQIARPIPLSAAGCLALASGAMAFVLSSTVGGFSTSAALIGVGWSLIMLGTTLWIHGNGKISRCLLGLHDSILLTGAILGALAAKAFA